MESMHSHHGSTQTSCWCEGGCNHELGIIENYGHGHTVEYKLFVEKDTWFILSSFTDDAGD